MHLFGRIIGKVAFTNKHQWIFSSTNKVAVTTGIVNSKRNMRSQPDKVSQFYLSCQMV